MQTLYTYNGQYPVPLPERIRLTDGSTITNVNNLDEVFLLSIGYTKVVFPPEINTNYHKLEWINNQWVTLPLSAEELEAKKKKQWDTILQLREKLFSMNEWRIQRYFSEIRLGKVATDDITALDIYFQALRDITKQEDPFNIVWPTQP